MADNTYAYNTLHTLLTYKNAVITFTTCFPTKVIQRRQDGNTSFHRDWTHYKSGFGDAASEFWLGNEHISRMTTHRPYTLRVELQADDGGVGHAEYDRFVIGPESAHYALTLGVYLHTSTVGGYYNII